MRVVTICVGCDADRRNVFVKRHRRVEKRSESRLQSALSLTAERKAATSHFRVFREQLWIYALC